MFTKGKNIGIKEDVLYYYKVTYTDENGEEKGEYVAKINLKMIEATAEEEAIDSHGKLRRNKNERL